MGVAFGFNDQDNKLKKSREKAGKKYIMEGTKQEKREEVRAVRKNNRLVPKWQVVLIMVVVRACYLSVI